MSRGRRQLGIELVKRLLIFSVLPIVVSGCGLAGDRDFRAYNGCLARHPQDAIVCDGPQRAYEVDVSDLLTTAASLPAAAYR
jgi:hypothetical protein